MKAHSPEVIRIGVSRGRYKDRSSGNIYPRIDTGFWKLRTIFQKSIQEPKPTII